MRNGLGRHLITLTPEQFRGLLRVINNISSQSQADTDSILIRLIGLSHRQLNVPTRCDVYSAFDSVFLQTRLHFEETMV